MNSVRTIVTSEVQAQRVEQIGVRSPEGFWMLIFTREKSLMLDSVTISVTRSIFLANSLVIF